MPLLPSPKPPRRWKWSDFNKDTKPDLVVGSDNTYALLGNGNGTFQAPLTVASALRSRWR
ncbi:MAG: VCBS repeat-containing protein [Gammaproteobacteria bacterium]